MANVKNVKIIEVSGKTYLGEVEKTDSGVIVKNALAVEGSLTLDHISKYILAESTGDLAEKAINGPGLCYTESNLNRDQSLKMQIDNLVMLEAKARTEQGLASEIFVRIKGALGLGK